MPEVGLAELEVTPADRSDPTIDAAQQLDRERTNGARFPLCPWRGELGVDRSSELVGQRLVVRRNINDGEPAAEGRVQRCDAPVGGVHRRHDPQIRRQGERSEEHKSELPSLMRISYAVFCFKKKNT